MSMRTKRIAMLAYPDVQMLDVIGPLEVFARTSRWLRDQGACRDEAYAVEIVGLKRGPFRASSGIRLYADRPGDAGVDAARLPPHHRRRAQRVPRPLQPAPEESRMKTRFHVPVPFLLRVAFCLFFVYCAPRVGQSVAPAVAQTQPKHYVCPPCGSPCDDVVYDHPGSCPACGLTLVEQGTQAAVAAPGRPVAILVFDGAEIIDFTGPWEVFGAAGFDVYTVAQAKDPITTAMGMKVVPRYTFADAPQPEVLLVPGGGVEGARASQATLKWVNDLMAKIGGAFATKGKWQKVSSKPASVDYRFEDEGGKPWTGTLTVLATETREYVVRVTIARAG
jgi:putative intracellular protease/amidase